MILPALGSSADFAATARDADRAMARACAARDRAAFARFLDGESIFVTRGGPARGASEIAAAWSALFEDGGPRLRWEPDESLRSEDGALAVTTGPVAGPRSGRVLLLSSPFRREPAGR